MYERVNIYCAGLNSTDLWGSGIQNFILGLENIEPEGLSEAELSMVKLERVWEVLFQALLLNDVKFEDGKMYAEL